MSGPTGLRALSAGVPVVPGAINPGGQAIRIGEACANSLDPTLAPGLDRPVGSILCRRNGIAAWLKVGPGLLDWQVVGASSGTGGVGGTSTASLERVVETRGQFLTGAAGLTFWHEPFVVGPAGAGSQWRDLHATDFHPADSVPGGVAQVFSNTGYGAIVVDPFAEYPGPAANHGWSIAGVLAAATPLYIFARFRLRPNPGTGGPGGWDGNCSFVIGLVDPTTQGIVGVGVGLGQNYFGAVGGNVVDHGAGGTPWLNGINAMSGIPSTVARDFDAWHTAELYTTGAAWMLRVDAGAAIDVSAIMPGTAVHGTPIVEVVGFGVTSPALEVDHLAIGTARNGAALAPLGPDPGGVSNVTARAPLTSTGGATPLIAWPSTYDNVPARLDGLDATAAALSGSISALATGLSWKASVVAATTANGTLATAFANGQVVDGVALHTGDRVLLKDQTAGAANGIYVVAASGAPTRADDCNSAAGLEAAACFVQGGTVNANRAFTQTADSIVVGTTVLTWVTFAAAVGVLVAAQNLSDLLNAGTARTNLGLGAVAALATPAAVAAYVGSAVAVAGAALADAAATLTVAGGNCYTMPAGTLTAARVLTLGTGGTPLAGEVITVIRLDAGAFTLTLQDDAGTVLTVLPASTKAIASGRWNGTHFADAAVQRVA
jgi:hypothetical protein